MGQFPPKVTEHFIEFGLLSLHQPRHPLPCHESWQSSILRDHRLLLYSWAALGKFLHFSGPLFLQCRDGNTSLFSKAFAKIQYHAGRVTITILLFHLPLLKHIFNSFYLSKEYQIIGGASSSQCVKISQRTHRHRQEQGSATWSCASEQNIIVSGNLIFHVRKSALQIRHYIGFFYSSCH